MVHDHAGQANFIILAILPIPCREFIDTYRNELAGKGKMFVDLTVTCAMLSTPSGLWVIVPAILTMLFACYRLTTWSPSCRTCRPTPTSLPRPRQLSQGQAERSHSILGEGLGKPDGQLDREQQVSASRSGRRPGRQGGSLSNASEGRVGAARLWELRR